MRLAIAGSSSFLSFVASFLAVSEFLGGGPFGIGVSGALGGTVGAFLLFRWPSFTENRTARKHSTKPSVLICPPGPHHVAPGDSTKVPLGVNKGDVIKGYLEELDKYPFSWQILDEENYIRLIKRERMKVVRGENDVPASRIHWTVRRDGPWFLLMSVPGKQLTRQVEVQLRKS